MSLKQIFRSLVDTLRVPVDEAVQMLSLTPATIAKVNQNIGSIQVGKRAGILHFFLIIIYLENYYLYFNF